MQLIFLGVIYAIFKNKFFQHDKKKKSHLKGRSSRFKIQAALLLFLFCFVFVVVFYFQTGVDPGGGGGSRGGGLGG